MERGGRDAINAERLGLEGTKRFCVVVSRPVDGSALSAERFRWRLAGAATTRTTGKYGRKAGIANGLESVQEVYIEGVPRVDVILGAKVGG